MCKVAFLLFINIAPSCLLVSAMDTHTWPIPYLASLDHMPIVQVRLAPPHKPLPQISAEIGSLEKSREMLEMEQEVELERAFNTTLEAAQAQMQAVIDSTMRPFQSSLGLKSLGFLGHYPPVRRTEPMRAAAFLGTHEQNDKAVGGDDLVVKVNLIPIPTPDPAIKPRIDDIEMKRSQSERNLFQQAIVEMKSLTTVVLNAFEAEINRHIEEFVHAVAFQQHSHGQLVSMKAKSHASGFLHVSQPLLPSGLQQRTSVRVSASDEPFPSIVSLVQDMELHRDAKEKTERTRILEMELKLLNAENNAMRKSLQHAVENVLMDYASLKAKVA